MRESYLKNYNIVENDKSHRRNDFPTEHIENI